MDATDPSHLSSPQTYTLGQVIAVASSNPKVDSSASDVAALVSLDQRVPLFLLCLTPCLILYLTIQLMQQINGFVKLIKKK